MSRSYGTGTAHTVRRFQSANRVTVSGVAGRQTLERLGFDVSGIR